MTRYIRPETLDAAVTALAEAGPDAKLLAGGLAVGIFLRNGLITPETLIDIRELPELSQILVTESGTLEIGTAVTHRQIELSVQVQQHSAVISEMERVVGSVQVRNNGTIGGNICHSDSAEDPPPVLISLDASIVLRSVRGEREVSLEEFFTGYLESVLQPDEVAVAVRVPPLAPGTGCTYIKLAKRAAVDFPIVGAAAAVTIDGGRVSAARVVLPAVAATPWVCRSTGMLIGQIPTDDLLAEFGRSVSEEVHPTGDTAASGTYKKHAAGVVAKRAVAEAAKRAR